MQNKHDGHPPDGGEHEWDPLLFQEVSDATPGESRLGMCIQCGTCGGSCPSAADMDHTPRMLIALLRAGMRDEVLRSNTPWICVSCYECTVRCPQQVHITDVMYTLKSMAVRAELYTEATPPDFSKTFIDLVETYGRSFELGLATVHYLKHYPLRLPGMVPTSLGLLARKRISLVPKRIRNMDQLTAILDRARELELEA